MSENNQVTRPVSSIASIAAALAKAQSEMIQPEKNKSVAVKNAEGRTLYTFDYADYNAIVEAVKGPLSKNGICFTHIVEYRGNDLMLITMLIHSSGEILQTLYPLPRAGNPKDFGGALTYGKRYSLSALTGCVADDDDDGAAVNPPGKVTTEFGPKPKPQAKIQPSGAVTGKPPVQSQVSTLPEEHRGITPAQGARLFAISGQHKWTHDQVKAEMQARWGLASTKELAQDQYDALITRIISGPYETEPTFDALGGFQGDFANSEHD